MGEKIGVDRSSFLDSIKSANAKDLIKEIYGYGCKGREPSIPEREAIYGFHLTVSTNYFIMLLFKKN
jgi:hypothetical protein